MKIDGPMPKRNEKWKRKKTVFIINGKNGIFFLNIIILYEYEIIHDWSLQKWNYNLAHYEIMWIYIELNPI